MDEQRSAAISDSARISTSTILPCDLEARGSTALPKLQSGFTVVRIVLGVLLLITAGLKLFDPSPDNFSGLELLSSPRGRMAGIEAEALLGIWLLTGAIPRLLWLTTLLGFSLLASVSFYLGIEGQSSCGCFGAKLPVSPWYALGLDLAALAALACWRPCQEYRSDSAMLRGFVFVVAGAGVMLAVGFGALTWMYGSPFQALIRLRGESITVEPSVSHVGDGVAGEQRIITIQLTNYREKPIEVIGGTTTCSCLATSDLPIILPPKETRSITVRINFRGSLGRFEHAFVLYTDEERQRPVTAQFTGRVIELSSP